MPYHVHRRWVFWLPEWQQNGSNPKILVLYGFKEAKKWTKFDVCKVAPLVQLAYSAALDLLKKQQKKRDTISNVLDISVLQPPIPKEDPPKEGQKITVEKTRNWSFWSRIIQKIRRHFGTKTKVLKIEEKTYRFPNF